jgi:hypothetical protein
MSCIMDKGGRKRKVTMRNRGKTKTSKKNQTKKKFM